MQEELSGKEGKTVIEQGVDGLGCEYKRTSNDFRFRWLEQDNCACSICHGTGAKIEMEYVTRNYQSPRTKKICKKLQAHEHSFWICPTCLENMNSKAREVKKRLQNEKEGVNG